MVLDVFDDHEELRAATAGALTWECLPAEARERLVRFLEAGARQEHPGRAIRVERSGPS